MNLNLMKKHVFIFILLSMTASVKADDNLVKDMVLFDQVYIPVLAMTSVENLKASQITMASFEPVWQAFKNRHYSQTGTDKQWKSDFDKVDHYIRAGKAIIARGTNIKDAHEELEHIRIVFMNLRERNNIEYYIDHLTRFHEPMENIVLAVKGKTEGSLTSEDIDLVRSTLPQAKNLWHVVSNAKIDKVLYGFNEEEIATLHELVKKEKASLQNLEKSLNDGDKKQIIKMGMAIKPNFAKLFKLFGHFPDPG